MTVNKPEETTANSLPNVQDVKLRLTNSSELIHQLPVHFYLNENKTQIYEELAELQALLQKNNWVQSVKQSTMNFFAKAMGLTAQTDKHTLKGSRNKQAEILLKNIQKHHNQLLLENAQLKSYCEEIDAFSEQFNKDIHNISNADELATCQTTQALKQSVEHQLQMLSNANKALQLAIERNHTIIKPISLFLKNGLSARLVHDMVVSISKI